MTHGEKLKIVRESQKITKVKLSRMTRLSLYYIRGIENNTVKVKFPVILDIYDKLGYELFPVSKEFFKKDDGTTN